MHDLVIRNGLVVDGSGEKPFIGDIAIDDEKISLVSESIKDKGKKEIDAVADVLYQIPKKNIVKMPTDTRAEGGDVMPWNEYIFVGTD